MPGPGKMEETGERGRFPKSKTAFGNEYQPHDEKKKKKRRRKKGKEGGGPNKEEAESRNSNSHGGKPTRKTSTSQCPTVESVIQPRGRGDEGQEGRRPTTQKLKSCPFSNSAGEGEDGNETKEN